jgi:hypothetical protein
MAPIEKRGSMSKTERIALTAAAAYALAVVVCFGPATVESERAQQEHKAECAKTPQQPCTWGPMLSDGLPKAIFWPFWLSYKLAKG